MDVQYVDVFKSVIIDVVSFSILGLFNLYVAKFLKPTFRGFYCNDESIRYPKHDSTVPSVTLNIVGISIPILLILIFELKNSKENKKGEPVYTIGAHKIKMTYWNIFNMLCCFGCGALFTELLTDTGKKVIGRLRPNFIDVCKPNFSSLCNGTELKYIDEYTCTEDERIVSESRVSFPSGHSSFAFYVAIFLVLYIQKKIKVRTILLKPIVQFLIILLAWFVALSRVMDNKHHWSDVLVGIIIGSGVAIINTVLVHRIFSEKKNVFVNCTNGNRTINTIHEAHAQL